MPLNRFNGNTFVAYIDISGFKELMRRNRALKALDSFYQSGYYQLQESQRHGESVEGLFVSDCGILFVRDTSDHRQGLLSLLRVIKRMNEEMLNKDYLLTTSIAFGRFAYNQRIEFYGIEKNPIFGQAYLSAFLDSEASTPKLQPGQCRIVTKNLPLGILDRIGDRGEDLFQYILERSGDKSHLYFYWMLTDRVHAQQFEESYGEAKYYGIRRILRNYSQGQLD